jgi:hypothetical protein
LIGPHGRFNPRGKATVKEKNYAIREREHSERRFDYGEQHGVVEAFVRLIETPAGERPFRTVPTAALQPLLEPYNALAATMRDTVARMFKVPEELTVLQRAA